MASSATVSNEALPDDVESTIPRQQLPEGVPAYVDRGIKENNRSRVELLRFLLRSMNSHVAYMSVQLSDELLQNISVLVLGRQDQTLEDILTLDEAYRYMFLCHYHKFMRDSQNPKEPDYFRKIRKREIHDPRTDMVRLTSGAVAVAEVMLKQSEERGLNKWLQLCYHHMAARIYNTMAPLMMMAKEEKMFFKVIQTSGEHLSAAMIIAARSNIRRAAEGPPYYFQLRLAQTSAFTEGFFTGCIGAARESWSNIKGQALMRSERFPDEKAALRSIIEDVDQDLRRQKTFLSKHKPPRDMWESERKMDAWRVYQAVDFHEWPFFPARPDPRFVSSTEQGDESRTHRPPSGDATYTSGRSVGERLRELDELDGLWTSSQPSPGQSSLAQDSDTSTAS